MKPTHAIFKLVNGEIDPVSHPVQYVDLSKETVDKTTYDLEIALMNKSFNVTFQMGAAYGYKQCAKDLLNAKL